MPKHLILLLDPFGTAEEIVEALGPDSEHFQVVRADRVDQGSGAFALMLGPETPLTAEDVRSLPELRIVAVTATGFDHVPVDTVVERGAWVTTAAGYCTDEVAEHALALLLSGLRGIPALNSSVRSGEWDVTRVAPRRIEGASVGLLGFGRIAQSVARKLVALGVRVKAYDPVGQDEWFSAAQVERVPSAIDILREVDAISLHAPLTPESDRFLRAETIAMLRPGTFVVNVARGGLIDPLALAEAIASGQISGAGLDVFEQEPLPLDDPLRDLPGVLLGPHGAWYSQGAERRLFSMATASILDVFHGRTPSGAVASPIP